MISRPYMFCHTHLRIVMLLLFLPLMSVRVAAQTYDENLLVQVLPESTAQSLTIELQNLNKPDPKTKGQAFYRTLIVPSLKVPKIEVVDYIVNVAEKEKPLGELGKEAFEKQFLYIAASSLVKYIPVGIFRRNPLGKLVLTPRVELPFKGRTLSIEVVELQVKLSFPAAGNTSAELSKDPLSDRLLPALAVNPDAGFTTNTVTNANMIERMSSLRKWGATLAESSQAGPVAQLTVHRSGPHVLSENELTSAGLDSKAFLPETIRLFSEGREVPLSIVAGEQGQWRAVFVAPEFSPHEIHSRSFFLFSNQPNQASQPLRASAQTLPPAAMGPDSIRGRLSLIERLDYLHKIRIDKDFSHWYWLEIPRNEFKSISFELTDLDTQGKDALVRLYLPVAEPQPENQCAIYVNGTKVGSVLWRGQNKVYEQAIPVSVLKEGINDLSLEFSLQDLKVPAESLFLSRLEIVHPQILRATKGAVFSTISLSGPANLNLQGFVDPLIVDVTEAGNPQFYAGSSATIDGTGERRVAIVEPQSIPHAAVTAIPSPSPLGERMTGVENIILAPAQFQPVLKRLIDHRKAQGISVDLVSLEDVFLQFGYGNHTPTAIRDFLRSVYTSTDTPQLSSVLLVGESSDLSGAPEDCPAEAGVEMTPVFWEKKPAAEPRGDFPYSLMDDDDKVPDLVVSRIPASTPEDLAAVIDKTIRYEVEMRSGIWRSRNLFINDDESVFVEISDSLKVKTIPGHFQTVNLNQQDYPYIHTYEGIDRKWAPEAAQELLKKLNEGSLTTLYIGHGGPNIWSHERLFHIDEMKKLKNEGAPTFLAIASCDSAWLDYPLEPGRFSLGERFIMQPEGGAIGVFAPVSGATPSDHQVLLEPYYSAIFKRQIHRSGDIALYAMLGYLSSQGGEVVKQYVLLGDPLTQVVPPANDISVFASPGLHLLKTASPVRISADWPGVDEGIATVSVRVNGRENRVLAADVPIRSGRIRYEWKSAGELPEGHHTISVYGQTRDGLREALGSADFEVVREAFQLVVDSQVLKPTVRKAGEEVRVAFSVENRYPAEARDITLLIRPVGSEQQPVAQNINLGPRERLSREMNVKMSEGLRALDFFVYGPGRSPEATESWERARLVFPVLQNEHDSARVESLGDLMEITPRDLPPDSPLRFNLPLWNLGGKATGPLEVALQDDSGRSIGAVQNLEKGLQPGEFATVEFEDPKGMPPGRRRVTATIRSAGSAEAFRPALATVDRILQIDPHSDLEFVAGSIRFDSKEFLDGQTVYIHAEVKNVGGRDSAPTTVEGFKGTEPQAANRISSSYGVTSVDVPALKPGAAHAVTLRWDDLHVAGNREVRLVVNPNNTVPENDYENNWIDGEVKIQPLGNIFLVDRKLTVTPSIVRPGQKVRLEGHVRTDRPQDLSELRVAFFGGNHEKTVKLLGDALQPAQGVQAEIPVSMEIVVDKNTHAFALEANFKRLLPETMFEDNRASASVDMLLSLADLTRMDNRFDLLADLNAGRLEGVRISPQGGITCDDFSSYTGQALPLSAANIRGPFVTQESAATMKDGKWLLTTAGRVEASPQEDVEPLTITAPWPEMPSKACIIHATVETNPKYRGEGPSSFLRMQLPGQDKLTSFDFTNAVLPWPIVRHPLGRVPRTVEHFQATLAHEGEKAWTVLDKIELVPMTGLYQSPLIDLGADNANASVRLAADVIAVDDAEARFGVAFGQIDAQGQPKWEQWQELTDLSQAVPVRGQIMQVRAYLMAGVAATPIVRSLQFELLR